jgi:choline dehydrogenase-like flavoprotein
MLLDCKELNNDQLISGDICIIGAGAAGITIAKSYLSSGTSVCLMESGAFEIDTETQDLYRGWTEFQGQKKKESYLHGSRLRYFGGTTNHWAGWCRPLDPIDFTRRDWVEYSGWPIDESDLKPYYSRAAEIVEIDPFKDYADEGRDCSGDQAIIDSDNMCSKYFHFSPPTRFGEKYRHELVDSENIKVCINANALRISLNESGDKVSHVEFATLTGIRFKVEARIVILATGGIENARLLLLSNDIQKNGIGNLHDQLGRYFMDHPQYPQAANIVFSDAPVNLDKFDRSKNKKSFAALGFSDKMQQKNHLLNTAIQVVPKAGNSHELLNAGGAIHFLDVLRTGQGKKDGPFFVWLQMISEINPDPNNRIFLDDEVDRFGLQKARLILNLTEQHINTVTKSIELFSTELARLSNGRARIDFREDDPLKNYFPANHHSGTTRMSTASKTGVVDGECKVHGVNNLYIAGSSVFPTTGFANPTFTIVALALRLSDHVRKILKHS